MAAMIACFGCAGMQSTAQKSKLSSRATAGSSAGELSIATVGDLSAVDPHFNFLDLNINMNRLVYETLIELDKDKNVKPLLATSWSLDEKDKTIWRFQLRNDVFFHRGEKLTKADVLATIDRIFAYQKYSKGGYTMILRDLNVARTKEMNQTGDAYVLYLVTNAPAPLFPSSLGAIFIMSEKDCRQAIEIQEQDVDVAGKDVSAKTLQAFASGELVNGSGPYRFKEWIPGQRVTVDRFAGYRDPSRTQWSSIHIIPEKDPVKRAQLLINRDVQAISGVTNQTISQLQQSGLTISRRAGLRNMHMQFAQNPLDGRDKKPTHVPVKIKGTDKVLPNPLLNKNFRKALSYAVNKEKLVADVMQGSGYPTGQYMPEGTVGYIKSIGKQYYRSKDVQGSIQRARAAMFAASAELPFLVNQEIEIPVHGTSDRYPQDGLLIQTLAQMWTEMFHFSMNGKKFALTFKPLPEPLSTYFKQNSTYLIGLLGGGVDNGQIEGALRLYFIPGSGLNAGGYTNEAVTNLYRQGSAEFNEKKREEIFVEAMKRVIRDYGFLPLFHLEEIMAYDQSLTTEHRIDGLMVGYEFKKRSQE